MVEQTLDTAAETFGQFDRTGIGRVDHADRRRPAQSVIGIATGGEGRFLRLGGVLPVIEEDRGDFGDVLELGGSAHSPRAPPEAAEAGGAARKGGSFVPQFNLPGMAPRYGAPAAEASAGEQHS